MKFPGLIFSGFILAFLPLLGLSTPGTLQFFEGNFAELKKEAAQRNLPYLVYCYHEDSVSCARMATETFSYAPLIEYADCSYLPYRMSADDLTLFPGLSSKVKTFPSVLVFGPEGQTWGQLQGFQTGPELLYGLRQFRFKHVSEQVPLSESVLPLPLAPRKPVEKVVTAPPIKVPASSRGNTRGSSFLDPLSEKELALTQAEKKSEAAALALASVESNGMVMEVNPHNALSGPLLSEVWREKLGWRPAEKGAQPISLMARYDLKRHRTRQPFGVEVGRCVNIANLEKEVKRYEKVWKGDIWTQQELVRGVEVFRLILGSYESTEEALAYALPMRRLGGVKAEVVDFRQLLTPNL